MLQTKKEIKEWLEKYGIFKYNINDDLTVDVSTDVSLFNKELIEIPIQFGVIYGGFLCNSNKLTSLKGCPFEVKRSFHCALNPLINLEFSPKIVLGDFNCYSTFLTSLKGFNSQIGGLFKHSCQDFEIYRIAELKNYYIEKKNIISGGNYWDLELSGKELNNIFSLLSLKEELSKELNNINTQSKQLKV